MAVLRKANVHLVVICRLIKQSVMQNKFQRRKTDSKLRGQLPRVFFIGWVPL